MGGSIYLRRDGRYEGRCRTSGENGRLCYFYGRSREEVVQKMQEFWENQSFDDAQLTVEMLFEEWREAIRLRVKESTLANYEGKARSHLLPAFGKLPIQDVDPARLQCFISEKLGKGLSAGYISDMVILFKSMMKFAVSRYNIRNRIQEVVLPKKKRAQIRLLSKGQQGSLHRYLNAHPDPTSLGVALSLFTGLRIGELCALRWEDVDLGRRTLSVTRTLQRIRTEKGTKLVLTEPKSESSVREIPLPECLVPMLKKLACSGETYVLSGTEKPVEPRLMQYRFQRLLKKAYLPSIHFHALRHMFATNCVEMGFDVKSLSEILGHSGVEITLNRYVHSSLERKKQFMKRLRFAA